MSLCVVDDGRGRGRILITTTRNDILAFVDATARGLRANNTTMFFVKQQDGFAEVAEMVKTGQVNIAGYKIIALIIGRADLWLPQQRFEEALQACVEAIELNNHLAIILLAATLPVPGDPRHLIETSATRSGIMAKLAAKYAKLEFQNRANALLGSRGRYCRIFRRK